MQRTSKKACSNIEKGMIDAAGGNTIVFNKNPGFIEARQFMAGVNKLRAMGKQYSSSKFLQYRTLFLLYQAHLHTLSNGTAGSVNAVIELHALYEESVCDCCDMLLKGKNEYRLMDLLKLYYDCAGDPPLSSKWLLYRFRALDALRMYAGIAGIFYKAYGYYRDRGKETSDEFEEIKEIYQNAHPYKDDRRAVMEPIYREVRDIMEQAQKQSATSATSLNDIRADILASQIQGISRAQVMSYVEIKNICSSTKGHYALAVIKFEKQADAATEDNDVAALKDGFLNMAPAVLRGHDMIAPYGDDEILLVMPNHSLESAESIKRRLGEKFEPMTQPHAIRMTIETQAL